MALICKWPLDDYNFTLENNSLLYGGNQNRSNDSLAFLSPTDKTSVPFRLCFEHYKIREKRGIILSRMISFPYSINSNSFEIRQGMRRRIIITEWPSIFLNDPIEFNSLDRTFTKNEDIISHSIKRRWIRTGGSGWLRNSGIIEREEGKKWNINK